MNLFKKWGERKNNQSRPKVVSAMIKNKKT